MIRYDWLALKGQGLGIILTVLVLLKYKKSLKRAPRVIYECMSKFKDQTSFMINVDKLVLNKEKHTSSELYVYLELASMRSYLEYEKYGKLSLPTIYLHGKYDLNKIKNNTALMVTEDEIFFKYEENE